ncbi:hypothetical protein N825_15065 [Skermanella stibiiresistens SB22]|uniref:Structural protein MipA n=1 Tax=Skermanella stibiiresistens SB22 TaxID=1385369 RepID=W9GZQ3_9PROT|nr:MipA/OmpV family protein [Skermanella stibiiresistens]EWY38071.1 hypothetical protein N825_15065 [Skermanella stibiiresistens SB22]
MAFGHWLALPASWGPFRFHPSRAAVILIGITGVLAPEQSLAQGAEGWGAGIFGSETSLMIGAGAILEPEYLGGDEMTVNPIPIFELDGMFGGHVFVSTSRGVGIDFLTRGPLKFSTAVNYAGGRDNDDGDRLRGLDEIDAGAKISAVLEYDFTPFTAAVEVNHRFGDGSGTTVKLGADYGFSPLPDLRVSLGASVRFADGSHTENFFGVTAVEAARATAAGNPLRTYEADAGIQDVGLKLSATYNLDKHWLVRSEVGVGMLLGDAADSPLTEREVRPSVFLGLAYRF